MAAPVAVFCCEASPAIGCGHVVRSQALADELWRSGWLCVFWVTPETVVSLGNLRGAQHRWIERTGFGPEFPTSIGGSKCDLLVVDNYRLGAEFEAICRTWAKRILVIDDLANRRHDCDILIDQTAGRSNEDYSGLVSSGCVTLTGPNYGLLRSQFLGHRARGLSRHCNPMPVGRVIVSLGGGDNGRLAALVLGAIEASGLDSDVDLVLGPGGLDREELKLILLNLGDRVTVHGAVENMADLLVEADLAVGAAGSSAWERCVLALPTIMIGVADNQEAVARELARLQAVEFVGWADQLERGPLAHSISILAADQDRRVRMAHAAAGICDGRGAQRALLALLGPVLSGEKSVQLRLMESTDEELVLGWQQHPLTRQFARNPSVPTREEHERWFRERLSDPDCLLCLVLFDANPAGVLRFDCIDSNHTRREVSILIAPEMHRLGIGTAALELGRRLLPGVELIAEVMPGNIGSERMFLASGYQRYHDGLLHNLPLT